MHYRLLNDENTRDLKQNTSLPQNMENKVSPVIVQITEDNSVLF